MSDRPKTLAELVSHTPERRTGSAGGCFNASEEMLRRTNQKLLDEWLECARGEVRFQLAVHVAQMINDGRRYVVNQDPMSETRTSGAGLEIRQTARVVLAHFEDAEVGEFVWVHAPDSRLAPGEVYPLDTLFVSAGPQHRKVLRRGEALPEKWPMNYSEFRRVPLGWERIR